MKLYTEDQVINSLKLAYANFTSLQGIIDRLTPIELPSDEEIEQRKGFEYSSQQQDAFVDGVKWMRDQLINANDK